MLNILKTNKTDAEINEAKEAKKQATAAKRAATIAAKKEKETAAPAAPAPAAPAALPAAKLPSNLEKLMAQDLKASTAVFNAVVTEYDAFKAFVLELENQSIFANADKMLNLAARIKEVYTGTSEDAGKYRITILNNISFVAYGKWVGRESDNTKKFIKGIGFDPVQVVLNANTAMRSLKFAIPALKPEGMKPAPRNTEQEKANKQKKEVEAKNGKSNTKGEAYTFETAIDATLAQLDIVLAFLKPGSNADAVTSIKCITQELENLKALKTGTDD